MKKQLPFFLLLFTTILLTSACTATFMTLMQDHRVVNAPAAKSAIVAAQPVKQFFHRPQPTPTPTPTPDPWLDAVDKAEEVLAEASLDAHFPVYQATADAIDDYLGQIEKVRPLLKFNDRLKNTNLPFIGNAWEKLVEGLNKASEGTGDSLEDLDQGLRGLLDSHKRLRRVAELDEIQAEIERFQANPSRATLEPLADVVARADFVLAGVDKDAADLQDSVGPLLDAIHRFQSGLALVSGLTPVLAEPLDKINDWVERMVSPLEEMAQTLKDVRQAITEDREIFWQLQEIIEQAKNPPNS